MTMLRIRAFLTAGIAGDHARESGQSSPPQPPSIYVSELNPVEAGLPVGAIATALGELPVGAMVISRSGTLGEVYGEEHPFNWMSTGPNTLRQAFCQPLIHPLIERRQRWLFRPHARDILSDANITLHFLREMLNEQQSSSALSPLGLALYVPDLLEASMLKDREDHLLRITTALEPMADILIQPGDGGTGHRYLFATSAGKDRISHNE